MPRFKVTTRVTYDIEIGAEVFNGFRKTSVWEGMTKFVSSDRGLAIVATKVQSDEEESGLQTNSLFSAVFELPKTGDGDVEEFAIIRGSPAILSAVTASMSTVDKKFANGGVISKSER